MLTNYFDKNIKNFHAATDEINHLCTSFAGHSINEIQSMFVWNLFVKIFSKCDSSIYALNFDCVTNEGIECIANVTVKGHVTIIKKEFFKDWCYMKYGIV